MARKHHKPEEIVGKLRQVEVPVGQGKQADFVAMLGDPLTDIAATAQVDFVMRTGRLYRHGLLAILR